MSSTALFQSIKPAILTELKQAKTKIQVAVAWFTDRELFAALIDQLQRKVAVSLLIRNDYVNNRQESLPWQQFIDAGGVLYFSPEAHALHHKFCLVDERVLISGSYNWTYMAEQRNQENCVFSTETVLIEQFNQEYQHLIKTLSPETQPARVILPVEPAAAYLATYADTDKALQSSPIQFSQQQSDELFKQGHQAALEMRYTDAVPLFQQVLAKEPAHFVALHNLALCYLYLNQPTQAIATSQRAEQADHIKTGYIVESMWNVRGEAYQLSGQAELAIQCFDKGIALRPWSSLARFKKWQTLRDAGRSKEAEACRQELLRTTRDGILKPHAKQDAVDTFYHHLHRADLFNDKVNARKAASAAQAVYNNLPADQRDERLQQMINNLILI